MKMILDAKFHLKMRILNFFGKICLKKVEKILFIINNPCIRKFFGYYKILSLKRKLFKRFPHPFHSQKKVLEIVQKLEWAI